ncbi:MAG: antibiotic biosynthesis monooxygenase [Psychrosphaera sp.]|nr:antibiotic biosynthesis monooxygenase [Psychrosphaera sp.]
MSAPLSLLVQIDAKSGKADELKTELLALLAPTRAEEGCNYYHFFTQDDKAGVFYFVETWATKANWEAHNESAHLKVFLDKVDDLVEEFTLTNITEHGA